MIGYRSSPDVDDDQGFSLVELLVVMSLLLVVGAIVLNGIVAGLRANERGQDRVVALTDMQRVAERLGRDLRFADPVVSATATQVVVEVLRDDAGTQVRHRITYAHNAAAGTLTETRQIFSATPVTRTTVMATDLSPGVTLFTFARSDGQTWVSGTDDPGDLAEFRLDLSRELDGQDPIALETSVFVRNVADGR